MDFQFLTEADYALLDEIQRQAYIAARNKHWAEMEAYDRAVGISVGKYDSWETLQKEHRADKADYSREMFLGGRLP